MKQLQSYSDMFTLSLRDSVSYGLGTKSVWTLALPQKSLVFNRSSSVLRLSLLLEQSDPLVTPPGEEQTNNKHGSKKAELITSFNSTAF